MSSLEQLALKFTTAFEQAKYDAAGALLPKIKIELARNGLIVPSKTASTTDLAAARQVLETGVFVSIHRRDEAEFGRLIAQLRPFYAKELNLPESPNRIKITALYLLLLLSKNEIAEFHTELESFGTTAGGNGGKDFGLTETDPFLRYSVLLERWLMEGSYDKVWKAITQSSQVPAPEFAILAESLIFTVRDEIALSAEHAYTSLPIANARHVFFFDSDRDVLEFAKNQAGWTVKGGAIYFPAKQTAEQDESTGTAAAASELPVSTPEKIIANGLDYAREIETII